MARLNKHAVSVTVPARLRQFWGEVVALMDSGDLSTTCESDDLLQCDYVYGGLADAESRGFGFTYFSDDDDCDVTWEIYLSEGELRRVVSGQQNTIQLYRCSDSRCPLMHCNADSYCQHCDNVLDDVDTHGELRRAHPDASDATIESLESLWRITHGLVKMSYASDQWPVHAICDAQGVPILSWRVALLPFIDHGELYRRIALNQPWDSAVNRRLWAEIPAIYRSGTAAALEATHVTAVIGDGTMWPRNGKRRVSDVTSGTSYTIAIVALAEWSTHWMRPDDITMEALLEMPRAHSVGRDGGGLFKAGMVDGHVTLLDRSDTETLTKRLLIG